MLARLTLENYTVNLAFGDVHVAKILWVENNARFLKAVGGLFLTSHHLTVVGNLAAAREHLAERAFDVILLDYDLDDGKGDELLRDIGRLTPRPPVIATSSHDRGNAALIAAGADVVCAKTRFADIDAIVEGCRQA